MSAHSASYYSQWNATHQNDPEKGERFCDHRHCISLAESACDSCENQFCDAHGDVEITADPNIELPCEYSPGVCWECMQERIDKAALNMIKHCTVLYTEADLCSPF